VTTLLNRLAAFRSPGKLGLFAFSPVAIFVVASILFGAATIVTTPPLRGHDETAHFLRAYGVALGDFVPSTRDGDGRKGVFLPARLYQDFAFFERIQLQEKGPGWRGYAPVMQTYFDSPRARVAPNAAPVFVPYAGSEGYSPLAYLPQTAAALVARGLDFDFTPTFYLMRFAGLAAFTALIAFAIASAPGLAWPIVAIAMLPSALYARSVISADGGALATAILVIALWVRGFAPAADNARAQLPWWMTLTALTKPTNLAFAALALATRRTGWRRWRPLAAALPAIVLAFGWALWSGIDTATWRLVKITGERADAFDASVKLVYLFKEPLYFPAAVIGAWQQQGFGELWWQLIGVLGLFDTVLQPWVYPVITMLLLASFATCIPIAAKLRVPVALTAAATLVLYVIAVYLICYVSFTPLDAGAVWGVQGRYFVPILPLVAIIAALTLNRSASEPVKAAMVTTLVLLSGCATIDAILRTDWHV
jgi:uncharacterized membrane protein